MSDSICFTDCTYFAENDKWQIIIKTTQHNTTMKLCWWMDKLLHLTWKNVNQPVVLGIDRAIRSAFASKSWWQSQTAQSMHTSNSLCWAQRRNSTHIFSMSKDSCKALDYFRWSNSSEQAFFSSGMKCLMGMTQPTIAGQWQKDLFRP